MVQVLEAPKPIDIRSRTADSKEWYATRDACRKIVLVRCYIFFHVIVSWVDEIQHMI